MRGYWEVFFYIFLTLNVGPVNPCTMHGLRKPRNQTVAVYSTVIYDDINLHVLCVYIYIRFSRIYYCWRIMYKYILVSPVILLVVCTFCTYSRIQPQTHVATTEAYIKNSSPESLETAVPGSRIGSMI